VRDHPSIGPAEDRLATVGQLHPVALLVDRAVVAAAELEEIVELGGTAVGPVLDMVGLA
jgi:hypothetical protein